MGPPMRTIDGSGRYLRVREALRLAELGDPGPAARLLLELRDDPSGPGRAWSSALSTQLTLRGNHHRPTCVEDLRALAPTSVEARRGCRSAAASLARLTALRFDVQGLSDARALHAELDDDLGSEAGLERVLLAGWAQWLEPGTGEADLIGAYRRARDAKLPGLAIEAQCLRALDALNREELEAATALARRASLMARSEGIPDAEVLANVVLARVRRHQDRPHLALRILAALEPHAPPAWSSWLEWEALLSGAPPSRRGVLPVVASCAAVIEAVATGRPEAAREATARLIAEAEAVPLRGDAESVIALLLHPDEPVSVPEFDRWRRGERADVPGGLAGLAFSTRGETALDPVARILLGPGLGAHRVPALAVSLVVARTRASVEPCAGPPRPRVDMGLATLALCSDGPIPRSTYFAKVYGYDYDAALHESMLNVHIMRMRERLGRWGDVRRSEGGLELVAHDAFVVRDPTCSEGLAQRALRVLAYHQGLSARELAAAMKIPLRTAQRTLKQLVADGESTTAKRGRSVVYGVEDTIFSEPTRSRRF